MARGDAVVFFEQVLDTANDDYQPAAGVVILITTFNSDQSAACREKCYNGSLESTILSGSTTEIAYIQTSIFDNTNYVRLTNDQGATREIGVFGYQIV